MQFFSRANLICSFFLLGSLCLVSCDKAQKESRAVKHDQNKFAAIVNQQKISVAELENEIRFISHTQMIPKKDLPEIKGTKEERKAFLEEIIHETLLLQEAEKLNLSISNREVQHEINKVIEAPIETFKKDLSDAGITYFEWKERLKKNLKIQKLIQLVILNNIVITDEELQEYYESNISDFQVPPGVDVYQILLKTEAEANIIHQQLVAKPSRWNNLAQDSIAEDGPKGYMGFFSRGELPEAMEEVIFSLRRNRISSVFKSFYGFHIYKVTKISKARTISLKEARSKVYQLISARKSEEHFRAWLNKVRDESTIVIYDKAL